MKWRCRLSDLSGFLNGTKALFIRSIAPQRHRLRAADTSMPCDTAARGGRSTRIHTRAHGGTAHLSRRCRRRQLWRTRGQRRGRRSRRRSCCYQRPAGHTGERPLCTPEKALYRVEHEKRCIKPPRIAGFSPVPLGGCRGMAALGINRTASLDA